MTTIVIIGLVIVLLAAIAWKLFQAQTGEPAKQVPVVAFEELMLKPTGPPTEEGIRQLVAQGELIQAIKLLRELRGGSLQEARDAVQEMTEEQDRQDEQEWAIPVAPKPGLTPAQAAAHPDLLRLLRQGRKIEAIKFYRDATGSGLKEAKDAVDEAAQKMH